jgi:hypothetical protein
MNCNSSSEDNVNSACQLKEELCKISLQSDSAFDYSEGDDVLYVTRQEIVAESFSFSGEAALSLDSQESSSGVASSGAWEYVLPDTECTDCIVGELGPERVRWFYKSDSHKRWIEFSGYDSLRIESEYRRSNHEWKVYNTTHSNQENSSGLCSGWTSPNNQSAFPVESSNGVNSDYECNGVGAPQTSDIDQHRIVVRGGMYEVDLNTCKCDSIYWPGRGIY